MRRQKMLMLALLLAGINMISGSAQTTNNQKPEEGTQEGKQNKKIEISGGVLVESNYSSFVHSGIGGWKKRNEAGRNDRRISESGNFQTFLNPTGTFTPLQRI